MHHKEKARRVAPGEALEAFRHDCRRDTFLNSRYYRLQQGSLLSIAPFWPARCEAAMSEPIGHEAIKALAAELGGRSKTWSR